MNSEKVKCIISLQKQEMFSIFPYLLAVWLQFGQNPIGIIINVENNFGLDFD